MDADAIRRRFRRIDLATYPRLRHLTRAEIYDGKMGPGGLFLAARMAEAVPLREDMQVMDLGCGRGRTSVFLAETYGVDVTAVDLWIAPDEIHATAKRLGCQRVRPVNHDAIRPWPFPEAHFDAVFCMDAFHYFGAVPGFVVHLATILKPGGRVVIGNPSFDREFASPPPRAYESFWPNEFSKYHSPAWWADVFRRSRAFTDVVAVELPDGIILWEDALLHDLVTGNDKGGRLGADADEIVCGQDDLSQPYLTHYILTARKRS